MAEIVVNDGMGENVSTPVNPSILSGKVAIQVNNEREFKLLMEHYNSKGWVSSRPVGRFCIEIHEAVDYHDEYFWSTATSQKNTFGYKIVPFADFATEVGIKVPVKIMVSEDGVDLYDGDRFWHSACHCDGKWYLNSSIRSYDNAFIAGNQRHRVLTSPEKHKAFSTKEAAEKWIEEQNKPKQANSGMNNHTQKATVFQEGKIIIEDNKSSITIHYYDLVRLIEVYKSLQ